MLDGEGLDGEGLDGEGLVVPDYGGACLSNVVPALLDRMAGVPAWMPPAVAGARQVVLLVLDGVGWDQLTEHRPLMPNLAAMDGSSVTTVVPSTTATALTSLTLGQAPGHHGIVGYRMHLGSGSILNVLRWRTAEGDARSAVPPAELQPQAPFAATEPVVVTRAEFAGTGFTVAHLRGGRLRGWGMPSSISVEVDAALTAGEPLVYAYYDGVDKVAHAHGLGGHYRAELAAADRIVGEIAAVLPAGAALVVTADHGHVDVRGRTETLDQEVIEACALVSGEARFRWLHAAPGDGERLTRLAVDRYGAEAILRTRDELEGDGWLGPVLGEAARARLGDVAVIATGATAYMDPTDPSEPRLGSRHGALTSAEMRVPLLAITA